MRYTTWVEKVFSAFAAVAARRPSGGFSLSEVGSELGYSHLDYGAFATHEGAAGALMTAAYDLDAIGLVEFKNVSYGNDLTPSGRDVAHRGIRSLWPEIGGITLRRDEEAFLATLYEHSKVEDAASATLAGLEPEPIFAELEPDLDNYTATMKLMTLMGDLDRKGMIRRSISGPGLGAYRPTYLGVVRISEPDARDHGLEAGVIDWGASTPGFEAVEDRLAELKTKLAVARSDDDLSDIGLRCRDIAAEAVSVVFRPEMVPAGSDLPSPGDAKRRLALYLDARLGGKALEHYRGFLRAALELANARAHSSGSGYAGAVTSAQGLLSFVRALEAIERSLTH